MSRYVITLILILSSPALGLGAPNVSRSSGVAPLYVHFDSDAAASTTEAQPFHNYEYLWSFGDSSSETWGTSGRSKNSDKGPVAAHVYETPGTYTATLTIRDASTGETVGSQSTFTITVSDPSSVFASTATTCVSTGSDFTGCPSGAVQVTTSSLSGLSGYTDAGERVLLKRGDSWTVGSAISFPNNSGPVHIGAFGACSSPDAETGICSNAPQVTTTVSLIALNNKEDWRIADINFVGSGTPNNCINGGQVTNNNTLLRVGITGYTYGVTFTPWRTSDSETVDKNAIVSSNIHDNGDYNIFMSSERFAALGNTIERVAYQHSFRSTYAYKNVIAHNIISGAEGAHHELKIHGSTPIGQTGQTFYGTYAQTGSSGTRYPTSFLVISNNVFGAGNNDWSVSIEPQNGTYYEPVTDVIFEKNRLFANYDGTGSGVTSMVRMGGAYNTVRNNIIDITDAGVGVVGISFEQRGIGPAPIRGRVYNNTIYSSTNQSTTGISIDANSANLIVRNNLSIVPLVAETLLSDSGSSTNSNNVSSDADILVDPDNVTVLSRDYSLKSTASVAIDQGYAVPLRDDFSGVLRTGTMDIGADSYETEAPPTCGDLIQNGDETGIDCGGSCPACSGGIQTRTRVYMGITPVSVGSTAVQ